MRLIFVKPTGDWSCAAASPRCDLPAAPTSGFGPGLASCTLTVEGSGNAGQVMALQRAAFIARVASSVKRATILRSGSRMVNTTSFNCELRGVMVIPLTSAAALDCNSPRFFAASSVEYKPATPHCRPGMERPDTGLLQVRHPGLCGFAIALRRERNRVAAEFFRIARWLIRSPSSMDANSTCARLPSAGLTPEVHAGGTRNSGAASLRPAHPACALAGSVKQS